MANALPEGGIKLSQTTHRTVPCVPVTRNGRIPIFPHGEGIAVLVVEEVNTADKSSAGNVQ